MPSSNRCVFGCVTTGVTIHKFPNPVKYPELFRTWVKLAAESLRGMKDDVIYRNRTVCDRHFADNVKNRNNRLNYLAVPTLHLPTIDPAALEMAKHLPSTSAAPMGNLSDIILINSTSDSTCGQLDTLVKSKPDLSHKIEIPQEQVLHNTPDISLTTSTVNTIINDHSYCKLPGQYNLSRTILPDQSAGSSKVLHGVTCSKRMQHDVKQLRSEICRLRKRSKNYRTRLASAIKLSNNKALHKVTEKMKLPAKLFTNIQFRETRKKPKGRRFTNEEKILALSLYKRSPKGYSLLSKCFTLPSMKSLKNLLGKIKITPGINSIIFDKLKHTVRDMSEDDRLCTLIFDEMSINPQVHYNSAQDELKGFTSIGTPNIADHVLTFMIRGVKKNFKQPIAYYFTSCLNKADLKNCIKEVINHVQSTGLEIIATVCDQSTVNVGAIESLINDSKTIYTRKGKEWRHDFIILGKKKIIPLFDIPHLIKGIRNNLLTKDLTYVDLEDGKNKLVKWEYFRKLYDADQSYGELKLLQKLTEEHVNPKKINKMKVKTATQMFSRSVAIAARHLVDSGKLDEECAQIAPFVLTIDKLFDSLNCNTFQPINGKIYRAGVKVNSPHHKLWQDSIKFLKNMKFLEKKTEANKIRLVEKIVPSIKNFVKTLEGMQALWKILNAKYGLDIMLCRNFNQDPIENFFGNIRSLGVRNVAPNAVGFEAAFKALLLNNFCSSHSIKANCEDDMSTFLQSVDFFLTTKIEDKIEERTEEFIINEDITNFQQTESNDPESYVCGWVLKKCCIKIIKGCVLCKSLMSDQNICSNSYIKAKEYENNKKWLSYPSEDLKQCFSEIQNITVNMLKEKINPKNIKCNIKVFIDIFVNFNVFNCTKHKNQLKLYFQDVTINIILYSWCRSINRILCGKLKYEGDDETKTKAQMFYNKHINNKNRK